MTYLNAKNTANGVQGGVQEGEQWANYLERYYESVQDLMKTRNKRRFYQQV
ncbi:hypothetical protein QUB20_13090 [Microcoleus sp. B4-C2]|uniref:hypothetical protein n=1 Tax=Microcoleus sp. B4-C2 TaxID=2818661 RepID=UPI002FCED394